MPEDRRLREPDGVGDGLCRQTIRPQLIRQPQRGGDDFRLAIVGGSSGHADASQ